ncbi:MAG: hypothetical protein LBQ68_03015 [Clostridiales bacterium]|nr:hypothetical protein [Clostridiales bacterium]
MVSSLKKLSSNKWAFKMLCLAVTCVIVLSTIMTGTYAWTGIYINKVGYSNYTTVDSTPLSTQIGELSTLSICNYVLNYNGTELSAEQESKPFEYMVEIPSMAGMSLEYEIYNHDDSLDARGMFIPAYSASHGQIFLKSDQKAVIYNVPVGALYRVRSIAEPGYETESVGSSGNIPSSDSAYAEFNQIYSDQYFGSLILSNRFSSDISKSFTYTVKFEQNGEAYTDSVRFVTTSGIEEFVTSPIQVTLTSGGVACTFKDLPLGIRYIVTQDDYIAYGIFPSQYEYKGYIIPGDNINLEFNNHYGLGNGVGSFKVYKSVIGTDAETDRQVTFDVEIRDPNCNYITSLFPHFSGSYTASDNYSIVNNQYFRITMSPLDTFEFPRLPSGYTYCVAEIIEPTDISEGYIPGIELTKGVIVDGVDELITFTNYYIENAAFVDVTKVVENAPDVDIDTLYTIDLYLNGNYSASYALRDGETSPAVPIRDGVYYEFVEKDYSEYGYFAYSEYAAGVTQFSDNVHATFTNTYIEEYGGYEALDTSVTECTPTEYPQYPSATPTPFYKEVPQTAADNTHYLWIAVLVVSSITLRMLMKKPVKLNKN